MTARILTLSLIAAALALPVSAQGERDADWPCAQPPAPPPAAATVWHGPALEGRGDWRGEPAVADLVRRIAPHAIASEEGVAAIDGFRRALPGDRLERERLVALAFAGLLEETDRERADLVARIRRLGERQRGLAALIARLTAEYDALPPGDERDELAQRRTYTVRTFEEVQRTMRYACDMPEALDTRLAAYARALTAPAP